MYLVYIRIGSTVWRCYPNEWCLAKSEILFEEKLYPLICESLILQRRIKTRSIDILGPPFTPASQENLFGISRETALQDKWCLGKEDIENSEPVFKE
jgi:hypothetical protein